MPGYIDRIVKRPACKECGGTDYLDIGFVHHLPTCSRSEFYKRTCQICHLTILPGEDRAYGPPVRHLDCAVELEAQLDEDHAELP